MTLKEEKARALFREGYNCAQSVVGAFCDEMQMEKETALRLASSFGGGMGRLREVCGTVSGMFLIAGALCGYDAPKDYEAKKEHYERIQELAARFQAENGSIVCRELLGAAGRDNSPAPSRRTEEYYKKRPCEELVGTAARIMEAYMAQQEG